MVSFDAVLCRNKTPGRNQPTTRPTEQLFTTLSECLRGMEQAGFSSWPNLFLYELATKHPSAARSVADAVLSSPETSLAGYFHVFLGGIGTWSPQEMRSLVQKAHATAVPVILRALAQHFWFSNRDTIPAGSELAVLKDLINSSDPHASRLAIESLRFLAKKDSNLALQLPPDLTLFPSAIGCSPLNQCPLPKIVKSAAQSDCPLAPTRWGTGFR